MGHKDNCDGLAYVYDGKGADRVKRCECGAVDSAPTTLSEREPNETLHIPKWEISLRVKPIKIAYRRRHC
jgi:hypothetical protein